jgi:plasmid stabilization system protein ParE
MQVELDDKFKRNFQTILEYIAKDKITASKNFKKELFKQIKNIPNFPYKYRKSFYFEDENVRDIIFKGYTVVYEVNINKGLIVVLDIFNQNKR